MFGFARLSALCCGRRVFCAAAVLVVAVLWAPAGGSAQEAVDLTSRLTPDVVQAIFPGAERIGPTEGEPPAAAVYRGEEIVGYVFSTLDTIAAVGYTTTPFDVLAGVTLLGDLTGIYLHDHSETIFDKGVPEIVLTRYLDRFSGYGAFRRNPDYPKPDVVSGGTTSARSMRNAAAKAAHVVLAARIDIPVRTKPEIDLDGFAPLTWTEMLDGQSLARLHLTNAAVRAAFAKSSAVPPANLGEPDETFIDLYATLATPRGIGENVLGNLYKREIGRTDDGGQILFLASLGPYSFRGNAYKREANGYRFDRIKVLQDGKTIEFVRADHFKIARRMFGVGGEPMRWSSIFFVDEATGFDPLKPWRLSLAVQDDEGVQPINFSIPFALPDRHILFSEPAPLPGWLEAWLNNLTEIALLMAMLVVLTLIIVFQDALTKRRRLHRVVRTGFLMATVGWLGWTVGAQFTIANMMNYARAPFLNLDWEFYLIDPLIFFISVYVAISLVLLGRGVFCGWLCPFGALQELLYKAARIVRLPVWTVPERLARGMRPIKYVTAVGLIALAFISTDTAGIAAEIEPFQTAIASKFARSWPFVVYAGLLLGAGLFVERFFCRFLCPLGGTLAILGRFHIFSRLHRRVECGSPCSVCSRSCPVKAIKVDGAIDMNECFRCLDCQVEYHDAHICPPLAQQRRRRERAAQQPVPVPVGAVAL